MTARPARFVAACILPAAAGQANPPGECSVPTHHVSLQQGVRDSFARLTTAARMCLKLACNGHGWLLAAYPAQAGADCLSELVGQLALAHRLLAECEGNLALVSNGVIDLHIESRDGRLDEYVNSAHHAALFVAEAAVVSAYKVLGLPVPRACLWKFPRDAEGLPYAEELVLPTAAGVGARRRSLDKHWKGLGLTRELFDRIWAGIRLESQRASAAWGEPAEVAEPALRMVGTTVYVREKPVSLNLTSERAEDARAFLGELLKDPGNWLSSTEIGKATQKEGVRFDRIFRVLPNLIKSHLESNRRKGYRVRR